MKESWKTFKEWLKQDKKEEDNWGNQSNGNRHYSQKSGHAERSVANDERKRSKRRGNY